MKKNYVIDTNILLHCPDSLLKFEEHNIFIPQIVVEELDGKKRAPGETGYNAREATRVLRSIMANGMVTPGGGKLTLYISEQPDTSKLPTGWSPTKPDNLILLQAMELRAKKRNVILVSNDENMQVKAFMLGIPAELYRNDRVETGQLKSRPVLYVDEDTINRFFAEQKPIPLDEIKAYEEETTELFQGCYAIVKSWSGQSALAKYDGEQFHPLAHMPNHPMGLRARNAGQKFLLNALMAPVEETPLVLCCGPAGTGKTLLALAAGLEKTIEPDKKQYKRILLCRPNVMMDEEIGFLPGGEQEKIAPLHRSVRDNLEVLLGTEEDDMRSLDDKIAELFQRGYVVTEALGYLRGRSVHDTFIIIDEAQNATANQIMAVATRPGEHTKIVICGDPDQIDNPKLDRSNNGLSFAVEKMKGSKLCDIITFVDSECVRSPLSKEVAKRMRM